MGAALGAADPFAIALWTLIACAFVFLVYLTVALGRFLRGIEDIRSQVAGLSQELAATARVMRDSLLSQPGTSLAPPQPRLPHVTPPPPAPLPHTAPAPQPAGVQAPAAPFAPEAPPVPPTPVPAAPPAPLLEPPAAYPRTIPLAAVPPAVPAAGPVPHPAPHPVSTAETPEQPVIPDLTAAPGPLPEPPGHTASPETGYAP